MIYMMYTYNLKKNLKKVIAQLLQRQFSLTCCIFMLFIFIISWEFISLLIFNRTFFY